MPFDTIPGPWGCWGAAGPPLGRGYGPPLGQSPFVWGYFVSREARLLHVSLPWARVLHGKRSVGASQETLFSFHVKVHEKGTFLHGKQSVLSREKREIVSRAKKFLSREARSSFHVKLSYVPVKNIILFHVKAGN